MLSSWFSGPLLLYVCIYVHKWSLWMKLLLFLSQGHCYFIQKLIIHHGVQHFMAVCMSLPTPHVACAWTSLLPLQTATVPQWRVHAVCGWWLGCRNCCCPRNWVWAELALGGSLYHLRTLGSCWFSCLHDSAPLSTMFELSACSIHGLLQQVGGWAHRDSWTSNPNKACSVFLSGTKQPYHPWVN